MGTIQQPRQEVLPVADRNYSFCQAVVFIDEVDLLIYAQAWTSPDVHLVPLMRRQMSTLQAPRTRRVQF